jgi:uncharacterized protein YkwD
MRIVRRSVFSSTTMLGAILLLGCTTPDKVSLGLQKPEHSNTIAPAPASQMSRLEAALLDTTNEFRLSHGLAPLQAEQKLMLIARRHAANMAKRDRFGDSDTDGHVMQGKDIAARVTEGGYHFNRIAENVGFGHGTHNPTESLMSMWKESPVERENLLHPGVVEMGLGVAQGKSGRWYFVQIFATPLGIQRRGSERMFARASVSQF